MGFGNVQANMDADSDHHRDADSDHHRDANEIAADEKAIIIDVRENKEWKDHEIKGALHIPLKQLLKGHLSELKEYKNTPVIIYCQDDIACSEQAYSALKEEGFAIVYNIQRGVVASER